MSAKDDNGFPVIYGVSHVDGLTPVQVKFTSARALMVDTTTIIQFSPTVVLTQNSTMYPLALATSSTDNTTVAPWVVNATTGAVLIDL